MGKGSGNCCSSPAVAEPIPTPAAAVAKPAPVVKPAPVLDNKMVNIAVVSCGV